MPVARVGVFRNGHQTLAREGGGRRLRDGVDITGQLVAVVLAAERDGLLRRLRERHTPAGARDAAARHLVAGRSAAERFRGNLLQLLDGILRRRMRRARHRVRGLAAGRDAGPRQILRGVAEHDITLLPRDVEHLGRHAVHVEDRMRAVIADAGLEADAAVRLDDEQAVEADRPGSERADRNADGSRLRRR